MARRQTTTFSMSFLDTICCAFGAIILLFVLSKFGEPKALEKSRLELEGRLLQLQEERYDIRGIALTGYGMEEDIERSQNAGFHVHLTKPIQVQSLDKALADLQR